MQEGKKIEEKNLEEATQKVKVTNSEKEKNARANDEKEYHGVLKMVCERRRRKGSE